MKNILIIISILLCILCTACKQNTDNYPPNNSITVGSIEGKAYYSNSNDASDIYILVECSDGIRTRSVSKAISENRGVNTVSSIATTITNKNGFYTINNLPEGLYTVYAGSNNSSEKAVKTNVYVNANSVTMVEDLKLTATGSIKGKITLDNSTTDSYGFFIYIAGTSFSAMTDKDGSFVITGVPAGKINGIIIQKGSLTYYWDEEFEVIPADSTILDTRNFDSNKFSEIKNKVYSIKYELNGGKFTEVPIYYHVADYKTEFTISPQKDNYVFGGWYFEEDFSGNKVDSLQGDYAGTTITIYAKWYNKIPIIYELNGGNFTENYPEYHSLAAETKLVVPEYGTHVFEGWYLDEECFEDVVYALDTVHSYGNQIKLYAKWVDYCFQYTDDEEKLQKIINEIPNECSVVKITPIMFNDNKSTKLYISLAKIIDDRHFDRIILDCSGLSYSPPDYLEPYSYIHNLKEIRIGGFEYIEDEFIKDFFCLEKIFISKHTKNIGKNVFANCSNLSSIKVSKDNPVYDSRNDCNAIIESSTNTLIAGCKNTIIPDSVEAIREGAINHTNIEFVHIPASVREIHFSNFNYCPDLSSITVSEDNPVFNSRNNCNAIIQTVKTETEEFEILLKGCKNTIIPDGIDAIGDQAFYGCPITHLKLPDSVCNILSNAFAESNIEQIDLNMVEHIGLGIFANCYDLTSIIWPDRYLSLSEAVFCGPSLNTIYFRGSEDSEYKPRLMSPYFDKPEIERITIIYNYAD